MKRVSWILMLVVIAVIASACGGQAPAATTVPSGDNNASSAGGPADVVQGYLNTVFTGEGDIASYFCSAISEDTRTQLVSAMSQLSDTYEQMGATVDLTGLTYTVENETADSATVAVGGVIKFTAAGNTQEAPMTGVSYTLKNENGWKLCS
jgi:hypothetical protein